MEPAKAPGRDHGGCDYYCWRLDYEDSSMTNEATPRTRKLLQSTSAPALEPQVQVPADVSSTPDTPLAIFLQAIGALRSANRRLRRRSKKQFGILCANIQRFRCRVPILVTGDGEIIDGHAIWEACKSLGHTTVATIVVDDLTSDEVRALRLSLNKIQDMSVWDEPALKLEFEDLFKNNPGLLAFTAFPTAEIDAYVGIGFGEPGNDDVPKTQPLVVSRLGDVWVFEGGHQLLCGDAGDKQSYDRLLGSVKISFVLTDPPYGCKIAGHVSRKHKEFVEGSGMTEEEALRFFEAFLACLVCYLADGAIVDTFVDGRGMLALMTALKSAGLKQAALCVWDKESGGMGSLYRQQTEFVVVSKWGSGSHINNVNLGKHGRNRTTLWSYPGLARFGHDRKQALEAHPTVKPVGLLTDAILDVSERGSVVFDPFVGSGSTLVAAHRTGRIGFGIELDPKYVDVAVRRMEKITGAPARLALTNQTFAEVANSRLNPESLAPTPQAQS